MNRISVIVPVLNDAEGLRSQRAFFAAARAGGHEVVIVDGGSGDDSLEVAAELTPKVLQAERGRALQMNAGARMARGELLLFLHVDTRLKPESLQTLLARHDRSGDGFWGRFDVRLDGDHPLYRVIEFMMNLRSRWTGIATGDQAIFVARALFERVGGFPPIALMEDVALCKILRRHAPPVCLRERAVASTRRWARHGIVATMLLMWGMRLSYFCGADPIRLARIYYGPEVGPGR